MCRPRKLSHTGDFAITPSSAKYLCAVPRTSGFFNTQFKEFDPTPNPDDEEQQSDYAETAKSNLTHNDEPTSPADGVPDSTEGNTADVPSKETEIIDLDDCQADPAARPDGGSLGERTPTELLLISRPFCKPPGLTPNSLPAICKVEES